MLKSVLGQHGGLPEDHPGAGAQSIDAHVVVELAQVEHFLADQLDGIRHRGDVHGGTGGCHCHLFRQDPLAVHSTRGKMLPVAPLQKHEVLRPIVHGTPRKREPGLPDRYHRIHWDIGRTSTSLVRGCIVSRSMRHYYTSDDNHTQFPLFLLLSLYEGR